MVNGEIGAEEEWKDEWGLGRVTWPNPTQASLVFFTPPQLFRGLLFYNR